MKERTQMNQIFTFVLIVSLFLMIGICWNDGVVASQAPYESEMRTIAEEINENSTLPITLLTSHEEIKDILRQNESITYINNFMSFDYFHEDYTIIFFGFPTDEDEFFLTEVILFNEVYDILGIHVLDEMAQARIMLEEHGFHQDGSTISSTYMKDSVIIKVEGEDIVETISVRLPSRYTSGNVY